MASVQHSLRDLSAAGALLLQDFSVLLEVPVFHAVIAIVSDAFSCDLVVRAAAELLSLANVVQFLKQTYPYR